MFNKLVAVLEKWPGPVLIFCAAALWSTAGGVIKSFEMDAILLPAVRSVVVALVLSPFLHIKQVRWNKWLPALILSYTLLCTCILMAIRYTTAANAIALQFTAPLWVFLGNAIIKRRLPSLRRCVPLVIMLIGLLIIVLGPQEGNGTLGNILAILAGGFFAVFSLCMPRVKTAGILSTLCLINFGAGLLIIIPLALLPNYSIQVPLQAWPYIFYLGIFQLTGGHVFYLVGLRKVSTQKATLLSTWEFILAPVWAFLLVGELPSANGIIGWVILLAAIIIENTIKEKPADPLLRV